MEKELKNLLASFEKAKEWDWSDMIQWINKVKVLVDSFQGEAFPEKITLEKRLWQCLNPTLPQGLHSITLKIYESILSKPWLSPEDFALFLTGILPFFQYTSPENRCQVLSILNNYYRERINEMKLSLQGVVISLLQGLDQDSNMEVERKTTDLLDGLALKGTQHELFYCVWQALLTTPRVRLGALNYLHKRIPKSDDYESMDEILPNKTLVVNALIATLSDPEILVRRTAMDLIIKHFPITSNEDLITTKEKIFLIESVLKLFLKEDKHITRRIWQWALCDDYQINDEILTEICELLIEAMKNIFSGECKCDNVTDPIRILEFLLEKDMIVINLMKELVVPMLIYAEKIKDETQPEVFSKCVGLLRKEQCISNDDIIWQALTYYYEENLYGNLIQAIKIIKFYFRSFGSLTENIELIQPLFESILMNLHDLGPQQLMASLDLAIVMVPRFENIKNSSISNAVKIYQQFFVTFSRDDGIDMNHFKIASELAVILEKFVEKEFDFEWVESLEDFNQSGTFLLNQTVSEKDIFFEVPLIKIENLIFLLRKGSEKVKEKIKKGDTMRSIVKQLWDTLSSEQVHHEKAVDLLIQFEKVSHSVFIEVIEEKIMLTRPLNDSDYFNLSLNHHDSNFILEQTIDDCLNNINLFTLFWKIAASKSSEILESMFSKGEVIKILIQHLEIDLPEISHRAAQWLIEILPNLNCVLSPIFNDLLANVNYYQSANDFSKVSEGLKQLRQIVKHGGDTVIKKAHSITLPEYLSENLFEIRRQQDSFYKHVDNDTKVSYLKVMVEISLLVLLGEQDLQKSPNSRDVLRVKVSACEFLLMILRQRDSELAYIAVDSVLVCLNKSFEQQDLPQEVLHLQLLNILNVIFFDCEIGNNKEKCKNLLESQIFQVIYLKGFTKKDSFIKTQWIHFVTKSFPMLISYASPVIFEQYAINLINGFCKELEVTTSKESLITGLKSILHKSLEKQTHNETEKKIKETFTMVIDHLVNCFKPCKAFFEICTLGTKPYVKGELKYTKDPKIVDLLKPIIEKEQHSIMNAFFQVWLNISLVNEPTTETNEKLLKLIGLIISLECDANSLFNWLKYSAYLMHSQKANGQFPTRLAHFVYTLSCFIPIEKFKNDYNFWDVFVEFCKEFEKVNISEVIIWINDIINLLLRRLVNEEKDKSAYRSLYEYTQRTIKNLTRICLEEQGSEVAYPFPPSLYEFNLSFTLNSGALVSLKSTLYTTVTILWRKETQEKIIAQFQSSTSQLIQALTHQSSVIYIDNQLMSELIASLINSGKSLLLAKMYRKEVIDFFMSSNFFTSMNNNIKCLESWSQIIRSISNACYGDRYSLITELFNRMATGVFTSRTSEELRLRNLKCISFAIYSGEIDEYHTCTQMICKKLIEFLKIDKADLKQYVYHCTIVMLLRLSSETLNDFWPRLWPHILTDIWQIITDPHKMNQDTYCQAIVIFIDILSTLMNQDFQLYKWIFFYESIDSLFEYNKKLEENEKIFTPLFAKISGAKYIGNRDEFEAIADPYKEVVKGLMIGDNNLDNEDHKVVLRIMLRDVLKHSRLNTVPNIEEVKKRIEIGFFR